MTNKELDEKLVTKVMGKCWHEPKGRKSFLLNHKLDEISCKKCGETHKSNNIIRNPSPTTNDSDYMELLRECQKKEKWDRFLWWIFQGHAEYDYAKAAFALLLDRENGCAAIAEFFGRE